jgi:PLP dependent protein
MTEIAERLTQVHERIARSAARASRDASDVRLLAVSKTVPVSAIREAYAAGQRDFGENYVQEIEHKARALADLPDVVFHLIGHLQSNKARHAVHWISTVHSVDSVKLVRELGRRAADTPVPEPRRFAVGGRSADARLVALVEVNVGGEAQKSGCAPEALGGVLAAVDAEPALALAGLMTVPPFTDDPAGARSHFDALAKLRDAHGGRERLPELSMGMTRDLEHAVYAGSTIVRVGTAIFGARG